MRVSETFRFFTPAQVWEVSKARHDCITTQADSGGCLLRSDAAIQPQLR